MNKVLGDVAHYSKERVLLDNISIQNYVTTDNLLQNKQGKVEAEKMPKQSSSTVTRYDDNDILIANIRPYLKKIWFANYSGGSSSDVLTLKVKRGHCPKFIYYSLFRDDFFDYMMSGSKGTKMPRGDKNQILDFPIPDFELNQQKQIAKVLSDLDAKIEVNNKINAELEAMAKLVYGYWFVQFDFPFDFAQGKPDFNGKPYKSSGGKMVYNEVLKREIPEGWEVDIVGNKLDVVLGGTPSTKRYEFWDGDIPWLNSGEVANFPIIDSEEKITQEGVNNSATVLMPKGTCVLSITRHLRASILAVDSCANQSVVGILETGNLKSEYLYPYLLNELPRLMSLRTGAQQPHINKGTVEESKILIPNTITLESYYSKVESFYKNIINNSKQNQQLTELRDWLLPMLMNGQVSVGEAKAQLSMVIEEGDKL